MVDLTPEYLDAIRDAARGITQYGTVRTDIADTPVATPYMVTATDGVEGEAIAFASTLGQAEILRTLLQAVPTLLDEVERLRSAAHRVWELNANEHQRSHDHHHEYKNGYADGIKAAQAAANGDPDE